MFISYTLWNVSNTTSFLKGQRKKERGKEEEKERRKLHQKTKKQKIKLTQERTPKSKFHKMEN